MTETEFREPAGGGTFALGVLLVTVFAWLLYANRPGQDSGEPSAREIAAAAALRWEQEIKSAVVIRNFSGELGGGGSVLLASFDIVNTSPSPVRDVELKCTLSAPSGTVVSTVSHTVYERIGPGVTVSRKRENLGFVHSQSARAGCTVVDLVVIAPPPKLDP